MSALHTRKHRVAKRPPVLTDGIKHPVVKTTLQRRLALEQAADTLATVLVAAIDADSPARTLS